jgi:hypothetical protein
MALNLRQVGDYFLLDSNVVPGRPKSGWTPVEGELVHREAAADNEFDVCATDQDPTGIVVTTNGATGTIGVAEFVPGCTIVLPFDTAPTLGDDITVSGGGLKDVGTAGFQRTQVKSGGGTNVGTVIDLAPFGVTGVGTETTATVRF